MAELRRCMITQVDIRAGRFDWLYLRSLWGGLRIALGNLWRHKETSRYPLGDPEISGAGLPRLTLDERGRVRCVACHLCSSACPAGCISIEGSEAPWADRLRFPRRFEIDAMRCISCGYCALACPVDALVMGERRPLATRERPLLVLDMEGLSRR